MSIRNSILRDDLAYIHARIGPRDRFRNSTVLVTGCGGFIGYMLMQYLVRYAPPLGIRKVIGLDTFLLGQPRWTMELAEERGDILDVRMFDIAKHRIEDIPDAREASYVIHAASIASPSFYRQFPLETLDANVWGLRRLLDFYAETGALKGFLFFSTSEIYGDPDPRFVPTSEEYNGNVSCTGPRACYDESKRFGETLCYVLAKTKNLPITIARPFNNYGPGMRVDDKRLPADFAKCVLEGRDIVILSDGTPTRTFCYIADAVIGYLQCLLHGECDSFNIGIEKPEIMVRDLAEIYRAVGKKEFGYTGKVIYERSADTEYLTDNPNRRCPIIAKARKKLGYDPSISVEDGVLRYLTFLRNEKEAA
jgi:UDP-glucuronate decarboxylase